MAGLAAFGMWGFLPIYFKVLDHVTALEILTHRIIWAIPFGLLIILARRQFVELGRSLRQPRTLGLLALSALFIAINWLIYVWAVQHDQIFQASLGYYINPLIYVVIGVVLFRETLRAFQVAAVALAVIGVAVLTISGGAFPVISFSLAISFTIYGVIRKQTNVGGMPGLLIETLLLAPVAVAYLYFLVRQGNAVFASGTATEDAVLLLAGPITVLPLLCFALAARRLNLATVGFMQFITPTMQFLVGVYYGERLTLPHMVCFGCIWIAVALFSFDAWRSSRRRVPVGQPA